MLQEALIHKEGPLPLQASTLELDSDSFSVLPELPLKLYAVYDPHWSGCTPGGKEGAMRKVLLVGVLVAVCIALLALAVFQAGGQVQVKPIIIKRLQTTNYYLIANLDQAKAAVRMERGQEETTFQGEIAFQVIPGEKGALSLQLKRLNLVSSGVASIIGDTGVIGLVLADEDSRVSYNSRSGKLSSGFHTTLHYELIDKLKGFRRVESKECVYFESYTETMTGKLMGRLPEALQLADKGRVPLQAEIQLVLAEPVVGTLKEITISFVVYLEWVVLVQLEPAEILKVQPVFIGTGPSDPNATGTSFSTLITRAAEIWNRCGTERCIRIVANPPIYVNNNAYRVLGSLAEAANLRAEVSVTDAVEIFVVERWDPYMDGGGACWSSGTASAKIVTCDQQLNVPCPPPSPPCSGTAYCGDVNYYHLGHELGHALNLAHPGPSGSLAPSSSTSIMEPSGFCRDNPAVQSARNCRNASNPLLYWGLGVCSGNPDIMD